MIFRMGVLLRVATLGPNVPRQRQIREGSRAQNCASGTRLYVTGEFIGGCDIIREMTEAGERGQLFDAKGIACDTSQKIP